MAKKSLLKAYLGIVIGVIIMIGLFIGILVLKNSLYKFTCAVAAISIITGVVLAFMPEKNKKVNEPNNSRED